MSGHWLGTDVPLKRHHERPGGMGLHICAVVQRGSGSSEHVEIVNDGDEPVPVTGLELTDCAGEDRHTHVYTFPEGELAAGQTAYVYSGEGRSQRARTGDLILYAGLQGLFWKDDSHVAYLRHPDGKIIDTMRAGRPPRHPNGH